MRDAAPLFSQCLIALLWCFAHAVTADGTWSPTLYSRSFGLIQNALYLDDSPVVLLQTAEEVYQSNDNGFSWNPLALNDDIGVAVKPQSIHQINCDNNLAFVLTNSPRQFYTVDMGKTWQHFDLPAGEYHGGEVQVNYHDHNLILFQFVSCAEDPETSSTICGDHTWYSKDGLKTAPLPLDIDANQCTWAKTNGNFKATDNNLMVCIKRDVDAFGLPQSSEIVASTDFFKSYMAMNDEDMKNSYVISLKVKGSFMIATVRSDRFSENSLIELYISKDGVNFHKAYFQDQLRRWLYKLLPSSKNSLHIAAFGASSSNSPVVDVYRSDSQGYYFRKMFANTRSSILDMNVINKVEGIDGCWIAAEDVGTNPQTLSPLSKSMITLDDGDSWRYLRTLDDNTCSNDEKCSVNLFWVGERSGNGDTVTGPTPGILMGLGAVGEYLPDSFDELKTFFSRDGGISWSKVADWPAAFTFADFGNIAVSVPINLQQFMEGNLNGITDKFRYSLDQGLTWNEVSLGTKVVPFYLITAKDGTAHQVIIIGLKAGDRTSVAITVDFSGALPRKCEKDDFEQFFARSDQDHPEGTCVNGHRQSYNRRKQSVSCFASELYKDIEVTDYPCACGFNDTECENGFHLDDDGKCVPIPEVMAETFCIGNNKKKKLKLPSRRMIPGSPCTGTYKIPDNDYNVDCKAINEEEAESRLRVMESNLNEKVVYYTYLDRDPNNDGIPDETLLLVTDTMSIYVSYNGGSSFGIPEALTRIKGKVSNVFTNPFFPNSVYVSTTDGSVYYSTNRAISFNMFKSPFIVPSNPSFDMTFSKTNATTFIWYSQKKCDSNGICVSDAAYTEDNGLTFTVLLADAHRCYFADSIFESDMQTVDPRFVICEERSGDNPWYNLVSSHDLFTTKKVDVSKVVGSTSSGEFFMTARLNDDNSLTAFVTVDGNTYAEAKFPADVEVTRQTAYTVLRVNSKQLFLHVTTNSESDHEFGSLLKGNYNGTLYVTSVRNVNRNYDAYVDYESIQNLEGISLLNVVANADDVVKKQAEKKLKTYITFNDGGSWNTLPPPDRDESGKKIKNCKGCSLHLHSYTERDDPTRDTFSSGSAVGMLFGLGNVGTELDAMTEDSLALYFTKDAGVSWKEVKKGKWMWEYGDQGSILVIADALENTNLIWYSLDYGETWKQYAFSQDSYSIKDLATVPSDTSAKFMLITEDQNGVSKVFTVDFSRVHQRQCNLELNENGSIQKGNGDFVYWTPIRGAQLDVCVFGHEAEYLTRNPKVTDCFIGAAPLSKGYRILRNCTCTREDYECDYNFEKAADGTCKLITGLEPEDHSFVCKKENILEFFEPTGYRKVPLSTCQGGKALDKWESKPCPGKEKQYYKDHRVEFHGFQLFMVIAVPLTAFLVSAAFIYDKGIRRNGGFERFGEIRLGDDDDLHLVEENGVDKVVNGIVRQGLHAYSFVNSSIQKMATFVNRRFLHRDHGIGSSTAPFFSDRIIDDNEDDSLFRYHDDDDDAREIDSFLDEGVENDVGDDEPAPSSDNPFEV